MKFCVAAAALAFAATLHAQDVAPELLPLAMKYRADAAALNGQKEQTISRLAQTYSAALDAAERVETTAGHVAAIAAITQERGDLKGNEVGPVLPNDLPKTLQAPRKTYLDGLTRAVADFGQRQQRLAADYLRALGTLQSRVGNNPVIAGQIDDEKKRVIGNPAAVAVPTDFLGVWMVKYDNGHWRKIKINASGIVTVLEIEGQSAAETEMKIYMRGADFLINWGDEDKMERLSMAKGRLRVEHFHPKSRYQDHKTPIIGTGTREAGR